MVHGTYLDDTRINFAFGGNVSANISEKDYKKYKNELTFDQLCHSMGNLFIEFFDYFKSGESSKIINKLKYVK